MLMVFFCRLPAYAQHRQEVYSRIAGNVGETLERERRQTMDHGGTEWDYIHTENSE